MLSVESHGAIGMSQFRKFYSQAMHCSPLLEQVIDTILACIGQARCGNSGSSSSLGFEHKFGYMSSHHDSFMLVHHHYI